MTPDELTITIISAIGGACLLSLLVALLVLANVDRLRRLLRIQPLQNPQPNLPAHYVIPYVQPGPFVEPMGRIHAPTPQRRTTYVHSSSDEQLPPRNATPSLSNVPRTPPPAYDPAEAEEYGRFLRTVFRSPTPDLPLITIPDSPEAPVRALLPESDNEALRPQTPLHNQPVHRPLPTGNIRIGTPAHLCPLPDSDNDSDSDSNPSDYGGNEPVAERDNDDPLNAHGLDFEWPELEAIDRAFLGPYRSQAWELRHIDVEQRSRFEGPENRIRMGRYLAISRGPPIPRLGRDATIAARIHHNRFRTDYYTSAGDRLRHLRPRTDEEQRALTDILLALALAEGGPSRSGRDKLTSTTSTKIKKRSAGLMKKKKWTPSSTRETIEATPPPPTSIINPSPSPTC
ncbi:uncharacterized protein ARMOST_01514 [Armillaria ostoyae]|uniref:Uncharacterized protein n=1 Tax=Armillaria ostoyae TaxID=47428 RepID=A0A284QP79_ARMOS|nr:uncharacterized protein ARMOST_01514 [Armillaria ostoyae]